MSVSSPRHICPLAKATLSAPTPGSRSVGQGRAQARSFGRLVETNTRLVQHQSHPIPIPTPNPISIHTNTEVGRLVKQAQAQVLAHARSVGGRSVSQKVAQLVQHQFHKIQSQSQLTPRSVGQLFDRSNTVNIPIRSTSRSVGPTSTPSTSEAKAKAKAQ